jgi:predicted outer membrane repeat protein
MWARSASRFATGMAVMVVLGVLALVPAQRAQAAVCDVPSPYPTIQSALNDASCAVIQLSATTFNEHITIGRDAYINGVAGAIVNGGQSGAVITINANVNVTLAHLTVTNGQSSDVGGGILDNGNLTASDLTVRGNSAAHSGGGIYIHGNLTLNSSTVMSNTADLGGGIYVYPLYGNLEMNDSTVNGNTSTGDGGGIWNGGGGLVVHRSTISGNAADQNAGGVYVNPATPVSFSESTIAFNLANAAGAHASATGGGIEVITETDVVYLKNSILDSNFVEACSLFCFPIPDNCAGPLISQDYNLISFVSNPCIISGTTGHNITNQGALLGPLAHNGGPTQTHALLKGSPAIDAIFYGQNGCGSNPTTDQRGWSRPYPAGKNCDVGAYERAAFDWLPLIIR